MKRKLKPVPAQMIIKVLEAFHVYRKKSSENIMHLCVGTIAHKFQIINAVIRWITIKVMNNLILAQWPAEFFRHKNTMEQITSASPLYQNISFLADSARAKITDKFDRGVSMPLEAAVMDTAISQVQIRQITPWKGAYWGVAFYLFDKIWIAIAPHSLAVHIAKALPGFDVSAPASFNDTFCVHKRSIAYAIQ